MLASKRAHQLDEGAPELLDHYSSHKNGGKALEEIVAGDVVIDPNEKDL